MKEVVKMDKELLKLAKVDLIRQGSIDATLLNNDIDASVLMAQARKATEYLNSFMAALKEQAINEVQEDMLPTHIETERYGVLMSVVNTGDRLDYAQDSVYADLQGKLKERAEMLKLAHRGGELYDSEGVLVPTVPVKTFGADVLKMKIK